MSENPAEVFLFQDQKIKEILSIGITTSKLNVVTPMDQKILGL